MPKKLISALSANWGGPRPGAGRKPTGRKKRMFFITDEENAQLRIYLKNLRKKS